VTLTIGGSEVFAKQGAGSPSNLIVAGLGRYPEITAKLQREGFDGPKIHHDVMEAIRTGRGHPDIMRLTALVLAVEPARLDVATVTGPLVMGQLGKGQSPAEQWGSPGGDREHGGGADPVSMERARAADKRASEIADGKSFREGTAIHARSKEYVVRIVELVYEAVKGQKIAGADQLRARILELLEQFDKAAGVNR
jgi:hypothetical protein